MDASKRQSPLPPQAPAQEIGVNDRPIKSTRQGADVEAERRRELQKKYKVYGKDAAVTVEIDRLRSGAATLSFEIAKALQDVHKSADEKYDWTRKVGFQLTEHELPQVVAMCAGYSGPMMMVEFRFHGEQRDKNFRLTEMNGYMLLTIQQGHRRASLRIETSDTFHLVSLGLRALIANHPHLGSETVLLLCKRSLTATVFEKKS